MKGNHLKSIRKGQGMNLAKLSKLSGFGVSTINNYENGQTEVSEKFVKKMAEVLRVTPADIVSKTPTGHAEGGLRSAGSPAMWINLTTKKIPVVSWARAGEAGNFSDLADFIDEYMFCDSRDDNAFALIIEGDSMEPEFKAGDRVAFEPNSVPRNGDFVVARFKDEGGVVFKRYKRLGKEGEVVRLESLNSDYKPIERHLSEFRFIYPAVEARKKLRK